MFRRSTKLTALLVAAASVASMTPVMAAERLGTKDGTIQYGIAFDGGKYIYSGYRTDDDDTGVYYNEGEKDKFIEDLEDYEIVGKYGQRYAFAVDGNDQYLVDLSTGKVVDDETDEEKRDSVAAKLRSTLKKTDRYEKTERFEHITVGERITSDRFGEVWYMYSANGDADQTTAPAVKASVKIDMPSDGTILDKVNNRVTTLNVAGTDVTLSTDYATVKSDIKAAVETAVTPIFAGSWNGNSFEATTAGKLSSADKAAITEAFANSDVKATVSTGSDGIAAGTPVQYTGFVNENGKYVDASNLANIYVYSHDAEKVVKVEEYNDYDSDNKVGVKLLGMQPIAQDKDYIYTLTTVQVLEADSEDNFNNNIPAVDSNGDELQNRIATFYQKIAKAQGDKKDDAYIPKSVESYEIADKSFYDDGDADDAYTAIMKDDDGYEVEDNLYTVKNGNLYVVRVKSDKVKVFKMKTKKVKADAAASTEISKKLDAPLVQKDSDTDHDIFESSKRDAEGLSAVSIDVDGNVWALDKGAIYKLDGMDFKEQYTCDRSIDTLDVYNESSLIAYEYDGDVYTTVQEGKEVTAGEVTEVVGEQPAPKTGWDQLADGTWNLYDAVGNKVTGWANVGGTWYYMDPTTAVMKTGWINDNGTWYYCNASGAMQTGWLNDNGTWYYLQSNGAMKTGWLNDNGTWYYLQSNGAMKTGWLNDNGTWYYLQSNGAMAANTTIDGYVLNASGAWVK